MTHPPRDQRRCSCAARARFAVFAVAASLSLLGGDLALGHEVSPQRMTPVVVAVRNARPSVVSIRGRKTVTEPAATENSAEASETPRQVNGMGTGTVIDERGYILTNYHVVSEVRRIEVTMDDGRGYVADLVAYDAAADLAVIKVPAPKPLNVIRLGTSSDLMVGESVIAVGNAYGYEQTVTRGVISALHRNDVEVSETQTYNNLIQTDASINPGNSGGPLLNIDGEMIGVNVAVRANAQSIGFAIPVDDALTVAARLLNVQRLRNKWHGLLTSNADSPNGPLLVMKVEDASPACRLGFHTGDQIVRVGTLATSRPLDIERALLDRGTGEAVTVEVRRGGQTFALDLALAESQLRAVGAAPAQEGDAAKVWEAIGLNLSQEPQTTFEHRSTRYRGGMHVDGVRPNSPAAQEGILPGDILVGMHKWETASAQDVQYIISQTKVSQSGKLKFYVLRGQNTLYGHLDVAAKPENADKATSRH
jgi:S1-C subfamily serine protease